MIHNALCSLFQTQDRARGPRLKTIDQVWVSTVALNKLLHQDPSSSFMILSIAVPYAGSLPKFRGTSDSTGELSWVFDLLVY